MRDKKEEIKMTVSQVKSNYNDLFKQFYEEALKEKLANNKLKTGSDKKTTDTNKDNDITEFSKATNIAVTEAVNEAKSKVQEIADKDQDKFTSEEDIAKKKKEADTKCQVLDDDWTKLLEQYNTLFRDIDPKTQEEIKISDDIKIIKHYKFMIDNINMTSEEKAAYAINYTNMIKEKAADCDEVKNQRETKTDDDYEIPIDEDWTKSIDFSNKLDDYLKDSIFDIKDEEVTA